MKKRFLWLLLAFSLLTSQVCSTVAYANLVVDVETVDVPDVGGETALPSVPMIGVELETEGAHTETSTTPQPADGVQPTADPQPEDAAEPVENASSSEISVDSYDALIKAIDQINAETDDAGKKYVISITDDFVCRSKQVDIRKDIMILGNGHTLTFEDRGDGSLLQFQMRTGGRLSLGMPDGGARNELTFDGEDHYRASAFLTVGSLSYKEKGELNIYDGVTITGLQGVPGQPGSTILVENGVFNMYGGKINGNTKDSAIPIAGTIAHYNPGVANITAEINLYGGEITGNTQKYSTSAYYAGAVMMIVAGNPAGSSAAFRVTGGTIADNDSSTRGKAGGVHLYGSAVRGTISGGQIDRNTAYEGGAICVGNGATLDITGGSCTGNKALDGAGIYIGRDAKVNLKNYRIADNVAGNDLIPGNGGGIYVYSNVDVTLEACEISGNTAIDNGAGASRPPASWLIWLILQHSTRFTASTSPKVHRLVPAFRLQRCRWAQSWKLSASQSSKIAQYKKTTRKGGLFCLFFGFVVAGHGVQQRLIDLLGVCAEGLFQQRCLLGICCVHFQCKYLVDAHAYQIIIFLHGFAVGRDDRIAVRLPYDTQRRTLCRFADGVGKAVLERCQRFPAFFADLVGGVGTGVGDCDVAGRNQLIERLLEVKPGKAVITPGAHVEHDLESCGIGQITHRI